jgi:putative addiction module component (TIGR02574 family)
MDIAATLAEIKTLPAQDRLRLVQAIGDDIEAEQGSVRLSDAQYRLLDRRITAYEANPGGVLTWDETEASLRDEV